MSNNQSDLEAQSNWARNLLQAYVDNIVKQDKYTIIDTIKNDGSGAFIRLLNSNYELVALNDEQQTALHLIFYEKAWTCLYFLIDKFSDDDYPKTQNCTNLKDCDNLTHLHIACVRGNLALVERYLNNNDDVNDRYNGDVSKLCSGFTPLHFAAINPNMCKKEIATKLIELGVNVNAVDTKGRTPLHISSQYFEKPKRTESVTMINIEIMEILVKNQCDVNLKDLDGNPPVLSIFPWNYDEYRMRRPSNDYSNDPFYHVSKYMSETKRKLQFFLDHAADMTATNKKNENILHRILFNLRRYRLDFEHAKFIFDDSNHIEIINQILSANTEININLKTINGETPLQMAVACMSPKIVELFLKHGADFSSLTFGEEGKLFFYYPDMAIIFEPMQDLISVLDLLADRDFSLSLKDKITVLKFLLHDGESCDCQSEPYTKMKFILHYADKFHNKEVLDRLYDDLEYFVDRTSEPDSCDSSYSDYQDYRDGCEHHMGVLHSNLLKYLYVMEFGNVHDDESVKTRVEDIIEDVLSRNFDGTFNKKSNVDKNLNILKGIKFENDVNLHDILKKDPQDTPRSIANSFDLKLIENLRYYKDAVKGHMTRARVRFLFENYSTDYFKILYDSLPDICCRAVLFYLDNKDILNLSLAAMMLNE